MDAITFPPAPTNEPNLTYAPGTPERETLLGELAKQEKKQHSFRAVIGGKRLYLLNNNGKLAAIHKHTGKKLWRRKLGALAAASPAYAWKR